MDLELSPAAGLTPSVMPLVTAVCLLELAEHCAEHWQSSPDMSACSAHEGRRPQLQAGGVSRAQLIEQHRV
jgi:hypothetical protein